MERPTLTLVQHATGDSSRASSRFHGLPYSERAQASTTSVLTAAVAAAAVAAAIAAVVAAATDAVATVSATAADTATAADIHVDIIF